MKKSLEFSGIKVVLMYITPEQAAKWLGKNENYRAAAESDVARIECDLKQGNMRVPPDVIAFIGNFRKLFNGQHRLIACRKTGIGFWALVGTGWPEVDSLNKFTDRNRTRTSAQDMFHLSLSHPAVCSTAIIQLAKLAKGQCVNRGKKAAPTHTQIYNIAVNIPAIAEAVEFTYKTGLKLHAKAAVAYYLCSLDDPSLAKKCFDAFLGRDPNASILHPFCQAYIKITEEAGKFSGEDCRLRNSDVLWLLLEAWNLAKRGHITDKKIRISTKKVLRMPPGVIERLQSQMLPLLGIEINEDVEEECGVA